jgi:CubicO group peptidase (beta-lactamase class C family)
VVNFYQWLARGLVVDGAMEHDERAYYLGGVAAHAGLFGSGHDLARFATMMLRGGILDSARILRPETIARWTASDWPRAP